MPALQQYFDAERQRRGWSMRETAKRSLMSVSKAYAIANGDDNVEFDTFENIASAFDMTPAELAVAIGKGAADADPDDVEIMALSRQLAPEQKTYAKSMLRGLVAAVTRGPNNGRRAATATGQRAEAARRAAAHKNGDYPDDTKDLSGPYRLLERLTGHALSGRAAFTAG